MGGSRVEHPCARLTGRCKLLNFVLDASLHQHQPLQDKTRDEAAKAGFERVIEIHVERHGNQRELAADGSLPPVGNTVNLETGAVDNSIGEPELSATWTDPPISAIW